MQSHLHERPSSNEADSYEETLGKQWSTVLTPHMHRMREFISAVPLGDSPTFNIGDYGTASGSSTMGVIRDLLRTLREKHGEDVEILVIHEEQKCNDFNALFSNVHGPLSYLQDMQKVHGLASATNFFNQCVPNKFMHFIMTPVAVHWLSKTVQLKDAIYGFPDGDKHEQLILSKQALEDWEQFLFMRSRELRKGGILVVTSPALHISDSECLVNLNTYMRIMNSIWTDFRNRDIITPEEFLNTNFPLFLSPLSMYTSPWGDPTSRISASGLKLVVAEDVIIPCVFHAAWKEKLEKTGVDDREEFARKWSVKTFMTGLSDTRTTEEKTTIVDRLYETFRKRIEQLDIDSLKNEWKLIFLVVQKE